jgi:DNA-binding winged helix-turn-helix (wHTH) protein
MLQSKHFETLYPPSTREAEISAIVPMIKKGLSVQLIGLPGSGKNNILNLLSYNKEVRLHNLKELEQYVHFVYIDCSELKDRSLLDTTKFFLISLSYSLNERGFITEANKVNTFTKEALPFADELILFQALKKSIDYLCEEREFTIVFSLDRFHDYVPEVTTQFFNNLKILRNRAKYRFSCIFAVNRPLEEILEPALFSDFYDFVVGNFVFVRLLDTIGMDFRFSYLEKTTDKKGDNSTKKEILELTGGHGKLTRVCYETALGLSKNDDLKTTLLKKTSVQGALFEIWLSLLPSEQVFLKSFITNNKTAEVPKYLQETGVIKNNKVQISLLNDFINTLSISTTEKIVIDPDTNEIVKGEQPITDLLSPSEFRLLLYLLQNKGKICTKDEIITATWKDTKTQEGVTDQALDQIIYRLRKKVEADPNHPHYIQTLKGRGYKFED